MFRRRDAAAWAICFRLNQDAKLRLLCFPFAGGGIATYRAWSKDLEPDVELWAIQLPGRDERRCEPPFTGLTPLVRALTDALAPTLPARFALFGHSMGALVAYEFARELRRRGASLPVHLFVSGRGAPHIPRPGPPLHLLSDAEILEQLRRFKGTPREVLDEPELMAMLLPVIRADFAVNEAEPHVAEEPLTCPISAFGGLADERERAPEVDAWREHTTGVFFSQMFPGDHFFLQSERDALLRAVGSQLQSHPAHSMSP